MMKDRGAQVLDWLARQFTWVGEEGVDLFRDAIDWVEDMGVFGYGLGAGVVLLVMLVLMWYSSRR